MKLTRRPKKNARITNSDKHWFVQGQNVFENMTCISEKKVRKEIENSNKETSTSSEQQAYNKWPLLVEQQ